MFVITVIPLAKNIFRDELSYFSADELPLGSIIAAPIKNGQSDAIVVACQPAADLKSALKSSTFSLKKIGSVKSRNLLSPAFIAAGRRAAEYFATPLGQTIKTAVPQAVLDHLGQKNKLPENSAPKLDRKGDGTVKQLKFILQDDTAERISFYKALIRESFARKESVFLCLPAAAMVDIYAEAFGPGIRDYTVILSGDQSPKTIWQNWTKAVSLEHPVLIIATAGYLSLPRCDLGTIILEREGSGHYRSFIRPFIDLRRLGEYLAEETGARLILGDLILRAETVFRAENGELSHLSPLKYRSSSTAAQLIIDARNSDAGDKSVKAIGDTLYGIIGESVARREKIIIYCGQKALSPITVCSDCGELVRCRHCASPLSLHKNLKEKKYYYLCHKCGRAGDVSDTCPSCGSWRLDLLGFGSEKAETELAALFPDVPLFLDRGKLRNAKRSELIKKFSATKGAAILLGTESLTSMLTDKVPTVAVIALDAMFSVPDFRISEKALGSLLSLRQFAGDRFVVQTRNPDEKVFRYAAAGNLIDFYREEIEERMKFGYPPFKILIAISRFGPPEQTRAEIHNLAEQLEKYAPIVYETERGDTRGRIEVRCLLKLAANAWPDPDLLGQLRALTPDWKLEVEPESII
jgi:primosomal protein N'